MDLADKQTSGDIFLIEDVRRTANTLGLSLVRLMKQEETQERSWRFKLVPSTLRYAFFGGQKTLGNLIAGNGLEVRPVCSVLPLSFRSGSESRDTGSDESRTGCCCRNLDIKVDKIKRPF